MGNILHKDPKQFLGERIYSYELVEYKGQGNVGAVYKAYSSDTADTVACKLIPAKKLKDNWVQEITKVNLLDGVPHVVNYRRHGTMLLDNKPYVFIFWRYVKGKNLREYCKQNPGSLTLSFIENLALQILGVFYAMNDVSQAIGQEIHHNDLHEGNILIANPDPRIREQQRTQMPQIEITDFGLASTQGSFEPLDDYESLARICLELLSQIDASGLDGQGKFFYDHFRYFAERELSEHDPTVGQYVRNPDILIEDLQKIHEEYEAIQLGKPSPTLKHPFDYLSCEQIGDSFNLLRNLYSLEFLGNKDLIERTNTVLTGPRGCGKTTIFRNMSLKSQLLSSALETTAQLDDWLGIYYSCKDLYYAFPYMRSELDRTDLEVTLHYFNLAILVAIVDTLTVFHIRLAEISQESLSHIEGFIKAEIPDYIVPPIGESTYRLRHLFDSVLREKMKIKTWLEQRDSPNPIRKYLGLDLIPRFCNLLRETIPWIKNRPIYLFLDDYSLPKVSSPLQRSINRVVFDRSEDCYFKISTESATTIEPYDADGKLLEEAREYDLIDLGDYFLFANEEDRYKFLTGIINNRLRQSEGIHKSYHDIAKILGNTPYSNNKLARDIVANKHVYYHGIETFVDLCSGDISHMLRLARDIFAQVGGPSQFQKARRNWIPIPADKQDRAIRRFGASYLNQLETITGTGPHLRRIVEAFGKVAHFQLCNIKSKNLRGNPPKQAFRIEMRSRPEFQEPDLFGLYSNLLRYGVFIRDARGKSQRGVVVPRLYLRRILIPTFRLTFSQRDNVGMEADEFLHLLREPSKFVKDFSRKHRRSEQRGFWR